MSTSYSDLVNVSSFGKKRESEFRSERGEITFFCRNCQKIIDPIRLSPQKIKKKMRTYLYECPLCHSQNIALGTREGIRDFYERGSHR